MFPLRYIKKFTNLLKYLFVTLPFERDEISFVRHNRKVWPREQAEPVDGEILAEVFPVASSMIAQSYLLNDLATRHRAQIVGFHPNGPSFLKHVYNFRFHRIYRSFNTKSFFYVDFSESQLERASKKSGEVLGSLKSKKDVEDLELDGIVIGDLLYDSYLMKNLVPTLDLKDPRFLDSIKEALAYFYFWKDYLESRPVKAVVVSHSVYYQNATIVRLCIHKNIPCYQVSAAYGYYLDHRHVRAHNEYLYYPQVFKSLSKEEQESGVAMAKERLEMRFKGAVGVDMAYSKKSSYGSKKKESLLADTSKRKILVAPHCFFDNPHPYGNNVFPDFYEWFLFLGEISKKTDYEWYVKTHPDFLPGNAPLIHKLIEKYPKFTYLPADSSHNQLIEEGISVVLTVHGTIGVEYAARGILVVNASLANPHVAYDFNLSVGSREEFERILLNLDGNPPAINKSDVYQYYYMNHLRKTDCWLYNDYKKLLEDIGGYQKEVLPICYRIFLSEFSMEKHSRTMETMKRFVDSKEYCLDKKHMAGSLR